MEVVINVLQHKAVVRAMPNTPAQIGLGMTVWTCPETLSQVHRDQAQAVFGSIGEEVYANDERYLDMATALSGTGPAYVFLFMEAMIDAGVHMGFSRNVSEQLVYQTVRGSVEYARQNGITKEQAYVRLLGQNPDIYTQYKLSKMADFGQPVS